MHGLLVVDVALRVLVAGHQLFHLLVGELLTWRHNTHRLSTRDDHQPWETTPYSKKSDTIALLSDILVGVATTSNTTDMVRTTRIM